MKTTLNSIIRTARTAEIQAIAIYEAELLFIRRADRRALLQKILSEERAHDAAMGDQVHLGALTLAMNRMAGWLLGSFLGCLPWRWMCRIQDWAEGQAAEIYERAAAQVKDLGAPDALIHALTLAGRQERDHASEFRRIIQRD